MNSTALAKQEPNGGGSALVRVEDELTVQDLVAQVTKIQEVMRAVMKPDEHYGVIPGTGTKPTLLKPGAEKLCLLFRLDPQYEISEIRDGSHLTITSRCMLFHIPTGQRRGSGMGSCSTRESKYAWRKAGRSCPSCGAETIIKGKKEYGGGWLCFAKKGGCGAKFKEGDAAIEGQETGRVPNEDIADQYNTVLKMANKRSLVAAVLNVTAASDIFTQDIEDLAVKAATEAEDEEPPKNGRTQKERPAAALVRRYDECASESIFRVLESERSAIWKDATKNEKTALKTASDEARQRILDTMDGPLPESDTNGAA